MPCSGQIEFDISSLSSEGEVKLLCFLCYDRLQVIPSLERSRVIRCVLSAPSLGERGSSLTDRLSPSCSNPSTWRNFVDGFSRVTGNFVIDVASASCPSLSRCCTSG